MGTIGDTRIETGRSYKYPSNLAKPFIAWLFQKSIHKGILRLQFSDETVDVGQGDLVCTIAPPSLPRFIWMLMRPDYRLPSQYTLGYWYCEKNRLYDFLNLLTSQHNSMLYWWFRQFNRNPIRDHVIYRLFPLTVKEHIAIHYNTSPDFMGLILGPRLAYTCAFFDDTHFTLDDAQSNKVDMIVERLAIHRTDRVLDLGCGWGQIAEAVANKSGASVIGLNLTPNQIEYARNHQSVLTKYVLSDFEAYNPNEQFDCLYSIGMLEHVGRGKLKGYFRKISEFLRQGGTALVHCIVRREAGSTNSWIDQEIFPGAYIPELSEVVREIESSNLLIKNVFFHDKSNYYKTLSAWLDNFYLNQDKLFTIINREVSQIDAEQIMRIWEFYLCGSRLAFNNYDGYCYNVQIVMTNLGSD